MLYIKLFKLLHGFCFQTEPWLTHCILSISKFCFALSEIHLFVIASPWGVRQPLIGCVASCVLVISYCGLLSPDSGVCSLWECKLHLGLGLFTRDFFPFPEAMQRTFVSPSWALRGNSHCTFSCWSWPSGSQHLMGLSHTSWPQCLEPTSWLVCGNIPNGLSAHPWGHFQNTVLGFKVPMLLARTRQSVTQVGAVPQSARLLLFRLGAPWTPSLLLPWLGPRQSWDVEILIW